ncbi:alpha-ketoglutarate-dependent dioxygenase AlkB [Marinobacter adhaerens]|uniref:Alpha-ketoglutarate-dependent dioxygenase AlkB n=1 Tax=Marinobacter salsuginis TaxID=418719 RepID=A0A5M3PQ76_9GAMM|nr:MULTISPECIES: DNA oxidative demethylase AlkB [Marinobacter]ODM31155.1 alpha-ketoglutarate-dependent dioxygenase AlkB [Marinobacter adhaerens]GBO84981.1 alpha-ketoglutarate-dependent dioxygenase AlkB [Marinobacter salsuginis]
MNHDLFDDLAPDRATEHLMDGALVIRQFALPNAESLMEGIEKVTSEAPFRHMKTPGGHSMSAAMSCCGNLGWVTDRQGYRYQSEDPESGRPWPAMPAVFRELARSAADTAGFEGFEPDACLINRYQPGAKMGLHQDKDEEDFSQPIVSVSLGLPIVFQFGGLKRNERPMRVPLGHGDVVVWGGPARMRYHGVLTLKAGEHPLTGGYRYNLTFRRAR